MRQMQSPQNASMPDHDERFARTVVFTRAIGDRLATRPIEHPLGWVIANDEWPESHSMNYLRIEARRPALDADAIEAAVMEAMDAVGRRHLQAIVEDHATGARVAGELRGRGWEVVELLTMAALHEPTRGADATAAVVSWNLVRPLVLRGWRENPEIAEEATAVMLTDRRAALAAATDLRHLIAPAPPAEGGAYADLYADGRTAQIEMVFTLPAFRNRGLASAVVLEGLRVARAEGHDLVFLVADAGDWPCQLYARLGFEEIGRSWELSKDR
jgi:GNAT superfamily N-acetyltransferase